jgi:hypothetical protein
MSLYASEGKERKSSSCAAPTHSLALSVNQYLTYTLDAVTAQHSSAHRLHMYAASSMACRAISYGEARVDISPGVGGEEWEGRRGKM